MTYSILTDIMKSMTAVDQHDLTAPSPEARPLVTEAILEDVLRPVDEDLELGSTTQRVLAAGTLEFIGDAQTIVCGYRGYSSNAIGSLERSKLFTEPVFVDIDPEEVRSRINIQRDNQEYVEYSNREETKGAVDELAEKALTEFRSRRYQEVYFKRLRTYIESAETAGDMLAITDAYLFMYEGAGKSESFKPVSFLTFMGDMFHRAADITVHEYDGTSNPQDIAEIMEPAVRAFIEHPVAQKMYSGQDRNRGIDQEVGSRLIQMPHGSAEFVAGHLVRERLTADGYNMRVTKPVRENIHIRGQRYLTANTIQYLYGAEKILSLPEGAHAISMGLNKITDTVATLAKGGQYPVATQMMGAFEKLKQAAKDPRKEAGRQITFRQFVNLVNAITDQLNQRAEFKGEAAMPRLGEDEFGSMHIGFQRLLYAIDERLLRESLDGDLADGGELRKTMALVEALAGQWEESVKGANMSRGEFAIRLAAFGKDRRSIDQTLRMLEDGGTRLAVRSLREMTEKLGSRGKKRAHWNREKSGHGILS